MSETVVETGRDQPLAMRVVRGSLLVALASYATIVIGFSATIIMARLLPPRDFGTMAIATFLFGLFNLRNKVGLGQAFVRDAEISGRALGTVYTLDLSCGLLSLVLALVVAPLLTLFGYNQEVIGVVLGLAVIGLFEAIGATPGLLLDQALLFGRTTVASAINLGLSYLPAIVLALQGWGVWSLVVQLVALAILNVVSYWFLARRELHEPWQLRWVFDWGLGKRYLRFGLVLGAAAVAGFLNSQFDNFLVGTFVGLTVLGFYDRAYRLASWPNLLFTSIIARTSFFAYAKLQDDRARLSKTFEMTLWIITTLALPFALVIFVSAPELVEFLLGPQWLPAALFLRILIIYSVIRPLLEDIGGLLTALGQPGLVSLTSWIQTIILIFIASALTFLFGAIGTAVAVCISFLIGGVLLYRRVVRWVDLSLFQAVGLPLLVTALTLALYLVLSSSLNLENLPLLTRLASEFILASSLFYLLLLAAQRGLFFERARYVWRLARGIV